MQVQFEIKDPQREARIYALRTAVAILFVVLCLVLVLGRYYALQVTEFETYQTQSEANRVQLQALPPRRGLIYDRNGVLLADNQPSYTLSVVRESVADLEATLAALRALVPVSENDLENFQKKLPRSRASEPVPLRFRLTQEERARLAVNRFRLPGVVVEAQLLRHYPHGELFSHAIGYVGRINEREAQILDETDYRGTNHVGKVGVEKYYENSLHGDVGYQNVESNAHGRVLRVLERFAPVPGKNLTLTLDYRIQRAAIDALGERRGAVVAIDPLSGGVLALVSTPGYDTNLFVNGISSSDYAALRDSLDVPLFNRAIQGTYPPGSTIKPFMAMAGLQTGLVTPLSTVPDPGWYSLPGDTHKYRDWVLRIRGTGHAPRVDMKMAIAESCDVYFYDLARRLTIDRMAEYLNPFGFGELTGIDTTSERGGVLPSTQWKRQAMGQPWYPGETISAGIGQGYMLASPLQLAVATSVVATRGKRWRPHLVMAVDAQPVAPTQSAPVQAPADYWDAVIDGMREVVHGARGTAKALANGIAYEMAGKTGTAQVIGIAQGAVYNESEVDERHRHHGLFIAFAPIESPTIAVGIIVENGGGSSAASPIARSVIDTWLAQDTVARSL
ncbi:MAG: penicillin-binding protein 2 [Halioglobus sp.]|nr:penicillin-binding protein 2 [Halioglobus sp.]